MVITYIFTFFLFIVQPSYENQVADQANSYLQKIDSRENLSENYWALIELHEATCGVSQTVIKSILTSEVQDVKEYFLEYPCGIDQEEKSRNKLDRLKKISLNEGLFSVAIYYMLNETETDSVHKFHNLFLLSFESSLSENEETILRSVLNYDPFDVSLIPDESYELVMYSILFQYELGTFFPSLDPNDLAVTWLDSFDLRFAETNIKSAIQASSIVLHLYILDEYASLHSFLPSFINQKDFPNSLKKISIFNGLIYSFNTVGRYDEALRLIRDYQLPFSTYLELKDLNESARFREGINLYSLGKFQEAKEIFEEIYYDSTSTIGEAELFNNLSICYLQLGEKNKYVNYLLEALSISDEGDKYKIKLTILKNLVDYYSSINDYNSSFQYLQEAEKIAITNDDYFELAAIHSFTGLFYWETEQNAELALAELNRAKNNFDIDNHYYSYVTSVKDISEIYTSVDSLDRAEEVLNELKETALTKSDTPNYLYSLIGLTKLANLRGDFTQASAILEEISLYPLDNLYFETAVKYSTLKSDLEFLTQNKRKAYQDLAPVIEQVIERARTSIDTQTGFWTIEQEYIDAFNSILGMLIALGEQEKAIQLLDEIKTINDAALYNSPILRANKLSEEDLAQDKILNDQIESLRTEYLNSSSDSDKFNIKSQIDILSARREDVLNKIRTDLPNSTISVWNIQRKLDNDEIIIHYTEIGDKLYTSYITKQDIGIEIVDLNKELKTLFKESADNLGSSSTDLNQLYTIYEKLNLKNSIPDGINKLTVIPDNYLYRIPIEILPKSRPSSPRSYGSAVYLLEDYHFEYFSSLSELIENSRNSSSNALNEFSAFAISNFSDLGNKNLPSLPYATQEVRNIDISLTSISNKNIYLENDATKASFIQEASSSRIVHIATHSEISELDPLFSTIYLNNSTRNTDNSANGTLYAYELFNTRMNSDLIMLNSCSSGSGEFLQGSGIMGISRALRYAGAKSLALNLWSVNDKVASEFATEFYTSIDKGLSKTEAMRNAKLSLLKTGNANPHYWGAYMLIGNPSSLVEKKPANAGFLYPFLIVMILITGLSVRSNSSLKHPTQHY